MYSEGFNWVLTYHLCDLVKNNNNTMAVESVNIIVNKYISKMFSVKTFEYINKIKQ